MSNHFVTLSGGHYTSYCRPSCGNVWYNCNQSKPQFYNTAECVSSTSSATDTSSFCGVRLGVGGETAWCLGGWMLGGKGWGEWCLAYDGYGEWRFSSRRMWVVECFGPFPILPTPLLSLISHTHRTNCLPYFPYSFMPFISHNNHTRAPHGLMLRACCSMSHPVVGRWSFP